MRVQSSSQGCVQSWPARICCTGSGCAANADELLATGETVHKRNSESATTLTAQEAQIARPAA